MVKQIIVLQGGGVRDPKTRFRTNAAAVRRADELNAYPGESIGSITQRAYGSNTPELRARLVKANATLEGTIRVPR